MYHYDLQCTYSIQSTLPKSNNHQIKLWDKVEVN